MDLIKLRKILDLDEGYDHLKEQMILQALSEDENVIPNLLRILERERQHNEELLYDTNSELSWALAVLDGINKSKIKTSWLKEQVPYRIKAIKKHYLKWADYIRCCINFEDLP